ncbi:MFS general substrate transporter [Delitschia confertaspora ATCC 74209]|uniref:MFS general substrate transporter n=1 Tax=Delitschia confertaspora ATCC 74209 TaxID=1513339 RepID=A0A9P4JNX1_9PLEO|nr:MFS general substrate transporter [Delitschia confertaspora ATCC 74209]
MAKSEASLDPTENSSQFKVKEDVELQEVPTKAEKHEDHSNNPWHPSQFPDGGREALLCLLGTFCCLFCSFGWLNCVGVFQSYYQTHQLREYSPSTVAWISSCEIFVMFVPGPIVGFLYDNHGPRYLLLFGTFMHVFGLMMTSLCSKYYQFILAQGICSPLGLNCIFTAATSSVTTWFFKKRGAAYGIMAAGSGLGGIIFPIMVSHLIPEVGYAWTMRISGFLILGLLTVALLTVRSRLPPRRRDFKLAHFLEPFKDRRWTFLAGASFLFFMGMFIPINFIEVQSLANGMSQKMASYLIPILNATSIFGRIVPGILADKLGRFNMQIFMSFLSGILVLALWLPSSSNVAFITFSAFYGFSSGAFVSLAPAQTAYISKVELIGIRTGMLFALISFAGLAGSPIAGAIVTREHGGFHELQAFTGVMMLAGAAMFVVTRIVVGGMKFARI